MASNMSWGGIPFMTPSTLAMRYLYYEHDIIPERRIEVGQRYRARKNLLDHVRGYRTLKRSLQRRLADIEHDRKLAHCEPSPRMSKSQMYMCEQNDFPRPNAPIFAQGGSYKMRYVQSPIFKQGIFPMTEPRAEEFLGLVDIRKKMIKNPSERMNADI